MTGHEYMNNYRRIVRKIKMLEDQIARDTILAQGVGAIRYDKDRVQTSPVADRMADIVANIIEATDKLKEEIIELQEYEETSIDILLQLPDNYAKVLIEHYVNDRSWSTVAVIMNYDDKYIYEVRDKALAELTKVLNESEQN